MALASEIVQKGSVSDLIRFGLVDYRLSILPSGRLGVSAGAYDEARDRFLQAYTTGEIGRLGDHFASHWRTLDSSNDVTPASAAQDEPTQLEFGLSLSDLLTFLAAVGAVGERGDGAQVQPVDLLLDRVAAELGWTRTKADRAFQYFAAEPRSDFLRPPSPFRKEDVYPWRFNKALSYLRKPLLFRAAGPARQVLWGSRHLREAGAYLVDLCVGGRLKANTVEMKRFITEVQQREAEAFNDAVAAVYEADAELLLLPA
jgi:hypothetical protein